MNPDGLLKMSELAERSGVSSATIKHYLREGLLGGGEGIVRTSRNMAYYPPDYVDRIQLIKRARQLRRIQFDNAILLQILRHIQRRGLQPGGRIELDGTGALQQQQEHADRQQKVSRPADESSCVLRHLAALSSLEEQRPGHLDQNPAEGCQKDKDADDDQTDEDGGKELER